MSRETGGRLPSAAFWHTKRVLVTGHTGFKGSWLTAWLTDLGAEVAGLALPQLPTSPSLWEVLDLTLALDHRADLCGNAWQDAVVEFDPQVVIHLAAQPLVTAGYQQPLLTFQTNVIGTAKLLDVASRVSSLESVLVATTDKVYDTSEPAPYTESSALGGADPYSASKACAELVVRSWPSLPVPVVTARAGNVIGGGDWGDHRLVPDLVRSWTSGNAVQLRQPEAVRPWQHVLEPLGGYLVYLERLAEVDDLSRTMNFGPSTPQNVSVRDVAALAADAWATAAGPVQRPTVTELAGQTMPETTTLMIDSSLASSLLDWRARLDWRSAVSATISWYAAYALGEDANFLLHEQIRRYSDRGGEVSQ